MSQITLEDIAENDEDPKVRIAAIQQLGTRISTILLEKIAKNDPDPQVREVAVRQLKF